MGKALGGASTQSGLKPRLPVQHFRSHPINSEHTAGVANLPGHHKDPFDRLLIAQATVEGITLLTNDVQVAAYSMSPIRLI